MASKKKLNSGTIQYTITSKALRPYKDNCKVYYTCSSDEEAEYDVRIEKLDRLLADGFVPPELIEHLTASQNRIGSSGYYSFAQLMRDYRGNGQAKKDDYSRLDIVAALYGGKKLTDINTHEWSNEFITYLKRDRNLSEATVRHYHGALNRCLDYAVRKGKITSVALKSELRGICCYTDADIEWLLENGKEIKYSTPRNRRPTLEEWNEIERVAAGGKPKNRERPLSLEHQAAFECLLKLAPETCMRLSELFTLTMEQVLFDQKVIRLPRTKNGHERIVPLNSLAISLINEYLQHVKAGIRGMTGFTHQLGLLFPFYPGDGRSKEENRELRAATSNLLSHRYATLFDAAGCPDLIFHDLRHEGISRLFERTELEQSEIQKISGHLTEKALSIYINLRASYLVEKIEGAAGMK